MKNERNFKGTGTYWHKNSRFCWKLRYKDSLTGKQRTKTISDISKSALNKKVKEFLNSMEHNNGRYETLTVAQYLSRWLNTKSAVRKPKTMDNYRGICYTHIIPYMGDFRMQMVRKEHVQQMLNLKAKTLSPSSVASIKRVFRIAMNDAMDEGVIDKNPVLRTETPKIEKKLPVAMEKEDMLLLFSLAHTSEFLPHSTHSISSSYLRKEYFVALCIAMATGLRKGELFALSWDKLNENILKVDRNIEEVKGGRYLSSPKTAASVRYVAIPKSLLSLLMEWKKTQNEYAIKLGDYFINSDNLIFTNSTGGLVSSSNLYKRWWNPLRKAAGMPNLKWHHLRSAGLSYFASHGVDMQTVSRLAGHSDIRTTMAFYIGLTNEQELKRLDVAEKWAQTVIPSLSTSTTTD